VALDPGNVVQNAIYLSGGTEWPVGFDAWEGRARETLERPAYDYVAGGAGAEETMRANLDAFRRRVLRPRSRSLHPAFGPSVTPLPAGPGMHPHDPVGLRAAHPLIHEGKAELTLLQELPWPCGLRSFRISKSIAFPCIGVLQRPLELKSGPGVPAVPVAY